MQNKETKKTGLARRQQGPIIYIAATLVIIVLLVVGIVAFRHKMNSVSYKDVRLGNTTFHVELADTDAKRAKGLSERDGIPQKGGMLFDFKQDGDWRMWMVQMRFPLDIAWLKKDGTIVYIKHDAKPADYPEIYHANQDSRYALEVQSGTFDALNVKEGDVAQIQ